MNSHQRKQVKLWLKYLRRVFVVVLLFYIIMILFHTSKALPEGLSVASPSYSVASEDIHFLADVTYQDETGEVVLEQDIFDEVHSMIEGAEEFIVIDLFLFDRAPADVEVHRRLSTELVDALVAKKQTHPEITIQVTSDPYNEFYGSIENENFVELEAAGISVVRTNLDVLRDSNPLYSGVWRLFVAPFGLPQPQDCIEGIVPYNDGNYCLRSVLKGANFKANHRKIIVADAGEDVRTLLTSANPSEYGSRYSNVGISLLEPKGEQGVWSEVLASEQTISELAGVEWPLSFSLIAPSGEGDAQVSFLSEGKIKESFLADIAQAQSGETIRIAQFLLTERDVISALEEASERGVHVEIILDPSKYLFGQDSQGIPNRPAMSALVEATKDFSTPVQVRWYDTHGEEFHAKTMMILKNDGRVIVYAGSANLTRRNIDDYNLEADVRVDALHSSAFGQQAWGYFDRLWFNEDGQYTLPYADFSDTSKKSYVKYYIQEQSGFCAW